MNFTTHNQKHLDPTGTCLQGYIDVSYDDLVTKFGAPFAGDGYKTDAEWIIEFDTGFIATIYNYKDGVNYMGNDGLPVTQIRDWHVGGESKTVVGLVQQILSS